MDKTIIDNLKFKTILVDGAIFVFMTSEQNLFLGVAEATRIDEDQKDLYEVRHFFAKKYEKGLPRKLLQKFIEEIEKNNIKLNIEYDSLSEKEDASEPMS